MKILIAAGAFKQSLTAAEVCAAIATGLQQSGLNADLEQLPIADGGNGTLDAFLAAGGERVTVTVRDPLGRLIQADYGLLDGGRTAVIEMALASGPGAVGAGRAEPDGRLDLWDGPADGGRAGAWRRAFHRRHGRQRHGRRRHGLPASPGAAAAGRTRA